MRAETEGLKQGCQLFVDPDVIARHETGVGCVHERAGFARALGIVESQHLLEVVEVACEALGSFAVEDVGADRSLFGGRGGGGEDLLRVREGQVGEPGEDSRQARGPLPLGLARFPGVRLRDRGGQQRMRFGGAQEPIGGVEPDGCAGRAVAAGRARR